MFDAFARFANGIIGHEASNQGGGGGRHACYVAPQAPAEEDEKAPELHLAGDTLRLSSSKAVRIAMVDLPPTDSRRA
ncbi:MAG TPA: hypothetical protein V6D05_14110 [Stenomitos sp.]